MKDIARTIDHPGTFIVEELEARGWSQVDLAYILGISPSQLSPILNGKLGISYDMAVALGDAFDVPAEFFANLQKQYELQNAKRPDPGIRARASWLSKFPVRDMIKRGWIDETEADLLDLQMMRFFGANRIEDVPLVGCEPIAHAAKKSGYEEITGNQLVWLHRVRKIAEAPEAPSFDRKKLISELPNIRAHMFDADDFGEIPALLLKCGIRLVFVEPLPGSKIDGACTWLGDEPVVGLSLRLNRPDNLCFVLRHEIEHVLQGDGKDATYSHVDVFENDRNASDLPDEERRADEAAAEFLVPQDKLGSFMRRKGKWISEDDVIAFSVRHQIHPAIVIGQIQNYRHKRGDERAFAFLRRYMTKVHEHFMEWPLRDGWGKIAEVVLWEHIVANYNEQLIRAWDEWEETTGNDANDPDDFIDWALDNRRLHTRPEDLRKIHRRRLSNALRQVHRVNQEGTTYRAKQCVTIIDEGRQRTLVFDVDKNGTPQLRQKAAKQRREGIANDVYRAKSDVDHMNFAYPNDEPIQFELDFTEDFEERKALERYEQEQSEAG